MQSYNSAGRKSLRPTRGGFGGASVRGRPSNSPRANEICFGNDGTVVLEEYDEDDDDGIDIVEKSGSFGSLPRRGRPTKQPVKEQINQKLDVLQPKKRGRPVGWRKDPSGKPVPYSNSKFAATEKESRRTKGDVGNPKFSSWHCEWEDCQPKRDRSNLATLRLHALKYHASSNETTSCQWRDCGETGPYSKDILIKHIEEHLRIMQRVRGSGPPSIGSGSSITSGQVPLQDVIYTDDSNPNRFTQARGRPKQSVYPKDDPRNYLMSSKQKPFVTIGDLFASNPGIRMMSEEEIQASHTRLREEAIIRAGGLEKYEKEELSRLEELNKQVRARDDKKQEEYERVMSLMKEHPDDPEAKKWKEFLETGVWDSKFEG